MSAAVHEPKAEAATGADDAPADKGAEVPDASRPSETSTAESDARYGGSDSSDPAPVVHEANLPDLSESDSAVAGSAASGLVKAPAPSTLRIPKGPVAPLRGSRESLVRQNEKSEAEGLERIEDSADLNDRIARGLLVPVPASPALTVNSTLPDELRYCRPWTAKFLADFARAHDALFHRPIIVSSAVRTVEYQRQLERVNGNAAAAEGDIVSPHLTGGTIDVAKSELPRQERDWMRAWLKPLETAGKIDVEEEFKQACFHITVYENYRPQPALDLAQKSPAKPKSRRRHPSVATALAVRAM